MKIHLLHKDEKGRFTESYTPGVNPVIVRFPNSPKGGKKGK